MKAYIEAELRDYHDTIKELEELRIELLEESAPRYEGRSGKIADPTGQKAVRLITNRRLSYMTRTVSAIDRVLGGLDETRQRLIALRYWQGKREFNDVGLAQELSIDRSTVYRWLEQILLAIAVEMGMIDGLDIKCSIKEMKKR